MHGHTPHGAVVFPVPAEFVINPLRAGELEQCWMNSIVGVVCSDKREWRLGCGLDEGLGEEGVDGKPGLRMRDATSVLWYNCLPLSYLYITRQLSFLKRISLSNANLVCSYLFKHFGKNRFDKLSLNYNITSDDSINMIKTKVWTLFADELFPRKRMRYFCGIRAGWMNLHPAPPPTTQYPQEVFERRTRPLARSFCH